jgi:hypothetical protein
VGGKQTRRNERHQQRDGKKRQLAGKAFHVKQLVNGLYNHVVKQFFRHATHAA